VEGGLAIPFFGFSFWSREMGLKPTATLGKQHPRIVLSAAGARVPEEYLALRKWA